MDQNNVLASFLVLELTNRLKERLAFDISDGSAYFNNGNFCIFSRWIAIETGLDLVCDVRDNLYSSSAEISTTFFLQYGPIDLTGCDVGILRQTFVDKTLVVTQGQGLSQHHRL